MTFEGKLVLWKARQEAPYRRREPTNNYGRVPLPSEKFAEHVARVRRANVRQVKAWRETI